MTVIWIVLSFLAAVACICGALVWMWAAANAMVEFYSFRNWPLAALCIVALAFVVNAIRLMF